MKSVSLRTRLEEPVKQFVFCKGSKLQGATLRGENKCCKWWMCIKRDQAAVSQRALAKSGRSTDDAAKYKAAWATMQLRTKC